MGGLCGFLSSCMVYLSSVATPAAGRIFAASGLVAVIFAPAICPQVRAIPAGCAAKICAGLRGFFVV